MKNIALDSLRERIAEAVACLKAYEVPSMCVRLGLQESVDEADKQEAFSSKRIYTKTRLANKDEVELLEVAENVIKEIDYEPLTELLSELTQHAKHRVSDLVRIDILKLLNSLENLFGDLNLIDVLAEIFGDSVIKDDPTGLLKTASLQGKIHQWYVRNNDWTNSELLTACGAVSCSQVRFFRLLEKLLHPIVRRDEDQSGLAASINQGLKRDGFEMRPVQTQSGYQIYGVLRITHGVGGVMKNLIFASIGEKPEIIIRDAVNNDIEIIKHADKVLIFDKPLPSNGALLWKDLLHWWADANGLPDADSAKEPLYRRLLQSVKNTNSPGEFAIFRTYYEQYGKKMGDSLPVLLPLPQIYLHYDPYTQRYRGDEKILMRQRMDFLLLLENGVRVVIEVDGQQHYSDQSSDGTQKYIANPKRYAEMVAADRWLRSSGYEVYRFGGYEFLGTKVATKEINECGRNSVIEFFDKLFKKYSVL